MKTDKTISKIRSVRHKISEQFDHDIEKVGKHYIRLQAKHKNRASTSRRAAIH